MHFFATTAALLISSLFASTIVAAPLGPAATVPGCAYTDAQVACPGAFDPPPWQKGLTCEHSCYPDEAKSFQADYCRMCVIGWTGYNETKDVPATCIAFLDKCSPPLPKPANGDASGTTDLGGPGRGPWAAWEDHTGPVDG
ncbi:MAG: hypothetical protein M1833_002296 [Piccolia ochrophora]|nr:MAG: hypothetical protein M1833_002296 [Piccolia ochrophora]